MLTNVDRLVFRPSLSHIGTSVFESCKIKDPEEQVNIAANAKTNYEETLEKFHPSNPQLGNIKPVRQENYIHFEDGENDDYLQNSLAVIHSGRVPRYVVLAGGHGKLRMEVAKWYWKKLSEDIDFEVPEILMGSHRDGEISVFDRVEGLGVIEESHRQELIAASELSTYATERESEVQKTHVIISNHIKAQEKVVIGLKTAPTDLVAVIDHLGVDEAKEKMLIVWATPGEIKVEKDEVKMHSKFNFYQDNEASDKLLSHKLNMILTGNGISDTKVRGLFASEHAAALHEVDSRYKVFSGFKDLPELWKNAEEKSFFWYYKKVQGSFQEVKLLYGKSVIDNVIEKAIQWIGENLKSRSSLDEASRAAIIDSLENLQAGKMDPTKEEYESIISQKILEDKLQNLKASLSKQIRKISLGSPESWTAVMEGQNANLKEMKSREGHLIGRWTDLLKRYPDFIEGCTADPHLEFFLNPKMRSVSVQEIIPVEIFRKEIESRPNIIDIKVVPTSNCFMATKLDSTILIANIQDLINRELQSSRGKALATPPKSSNI